MADDGPRDLAAALRHLSPARIGLGRVGQSLPLKAVLDFQLAHARARDAVHAGWSPEALARALGRPSLRVASEAHDTPTYLQRPDLGRRLRPDDLPRLAPLRAAAADALFVVADGLSGTAAMRHAAPLLDALIARLAGWTIADIVIAGRARVAIGDAIGAAAAAKLVVVLIGERPGLSAPDSLGAYLTWAPRVGRTDSERNCVSNIRPPVGLGYAEAADRIVWLMNEARRIGLTGVALKDRSQDRRLATATDPAAALDASAREAAPIDHMPRDQQR